MGVYVSACYSGSMFSSTTLLDTENLLKGFDSVGKMTGDLIKLNKDVDQVFLDADVPRTALTSFLRDFNMGLALCRVGAETPERKEFGAQLQQVRAVVERGANDGNIDIESLGASLQKYLESSVDVTASEEFLSKPYQCG